MSNKGITICFALMMFLLAIGVFCAYKVYTEEGPPIAKSVSTEVTEVTSTTLENPKYMMTFEIKQSHFTLDLAQHAKDAFNKLELVVMVDKDYYDTYNVGAEIAEEFRWGSFAFKGSYGSWKVKVTDKQIIEGSAE